MNEKKLKNTVLFTKLDIDLVVKKTKSSITKGFDGMNNNMIKNGYSNFISTYLLNFFNFIKKFQVIPKNFNLGIINPLIKDKNKSNKDILNQRPITISNVLAQMLERLLLEKMLILNSTSNSQFGFKPKSSCNHAIFTLKGTILNYIENGSKCYIVSLDAEKAFDRVWRDGLMYKLINKIDDELWLLIKKYYESSIGLIKDDNCLNAFEIKSGVKQGGILSPYLFNFYIDELLVTCEKSGLGAKIGDIRINNIAYCDDLILISPIGKQLQQLIELCEKYGTNWKINFNSKKSVIMVFGREKINNLKFDFKLNDTVINEQDEFKYLGISINNKLDFNKSILENFDKVRKAVFSLTAFGMKPNGISGYTKAFLYKTFCRTKGTYSIDAVTLNEKTIEKLDIMQNNLLRIIIGVHSKCKMTSLLSALYVDKIKDLYILQKAKFIERLKSNNLTKLIINYLSKSSVGKTLKTTSFIKDLRNVSKIFKMDINDLIENNKKRSEQIINVKKSCLLSDGIVDSIRFCLNNLTTKKHKDLLNLLLKSF